MDGEIHEPRLAPPSWQRRGWYTKWSAVLYPEPGYSRSSYLAVLSYLTQRSGISSGHLYVFHAHPAGVRGWYVLVAVCTSMIQVLVACKKYLQSIIVIVTVIMPGNKGSAEDKKKVIDLPGEESEL